MKNNKYKIFISTFGERVIKVKGGIPIEVGSLKNKNKRYPLHDDIGENISLENDYFGELTGLYWIWKNVRISDDDIIGFCHYNKALNISRRKAERWLKKHPNGFIVLSPGRQSPHEAVDEVEAIEASLKKRPLYYKVWQKHYDDKAANTAGTCFGCNMFITKGNSFKEFCSWLFEILMEVRASVGDKPDVIPYLRRYCAFMGERLLTVYTDSRQLPVLPVNKKIKEWWIPLIYPIVQALHINRDSCFFKYFSKRMGSGSSYK